MSALMWALMRAPGRALGLALALALAGAAMAQRATSDGPPPDTRRPGSAYMSPALQALQHDDTQNPAQLWVAEGQSLWQRAAANGRRCADCHALGEGPPPRHVATSAARHPVWDAARAKPLTLAGRIDQCRAQHLQLPAQGPEGPEVLALGALLAQQARGQPLRAPGAPGAPDEAALAPWIARGEALWRSRLGQLNLACMHCHDQRAGQRLGGAPIPQAHPTGYPLYRLEWQTLGSLQRRLRGCLVGVRAEPWAPAADEWLALETYLAKRASGMLHEGAALRP